MSSSLTAPTATHYAEVFAAAAQRGRLRAWTSAQLERELRDGPVASATHAEFSSMVMATFLARREWVADAGAGLGVEPAYRAVCRVRDQALNLATRVSYPSGWRQSVRIDAACGRHGRVA